MSACETRRRGFARRLSRVAGGLVSIVFLSAGGLCPATVGPERPQPGALLRGTATRPPLRLAVPMSSRSGSHLRLHVVRPGDTFFGIARAYRLEIGALMAANAAYDPGRLPVGAVLRLPAAAMASRRSPAVLRWLWPLRGRISSRYGRRWGRMHGGVDIASPAGTVVRAAAAGRVVWAGWRGGYGLLVILAHPDGWRTLYGHNSRLHVRSGEWVPAGGTLATIGATGNATGVHLHFEMVRNGKRVDPLSVLP